MALKPELQKALAKAKCPYCGKQRVRVLIVSREGSAELHEAVDGQVTVPLSAVAKLNRVAAGCAACGIAFDPSRADLPEQGWTD
jgi:transcription elongation factor Elf1